MHSETSLMSIFL